MKKNTALGSSLLLFLTASIWGMAFVSQSKGMEYMHPFTFNGVRSLIGSLSLVVYMALTGKLKKGAFTKAQWKQNIKAGLLCGLALTAATTLQQFGLLYTTVGKAGFITTLYIIFVPLAGIFIGKKVPGIVWGAAAMAAVGMYLLCMTESLVLGTGDTMVFICAVLFAMHILIIDHFAPQTDGVVVSCIQFLLCAVVCMAGAFLWGEPTFSQILSGKWALLYAGVMSCGVAYTLQIVAQKGINSTVAALIMSLESVVAAVAGWAAYRIGLLSTDQTLTVPQILGCAIVFAAVILVQLPAEWFAKSGKSKKAA